MTMTMKPDQVFELLTDQGLAVDLKWFGEVEYQVSHDAMKEYATTRTEHCPDELWLLEHPRVYTQGTACDQSTFVDSGIPIVKTDRGGQITYHGPGQIVMYVLLNLKRHKLGIKALVAALEQCVIDVLASYDLQSVRRKDAPGVYIDDAKIAALGLRIRRGNSYHGLSLNIDMDMTPFTNIDPCGYQDLQVAQLSQKLAEQSQSSKGDGRSLNTFEVGRMLATRFVELI